MADEQDRANTGAANRLEPFELRVAPVSRSNRRNSEATVIDLTDGSLLLAYTRFRAGVHDLSPADIVTCVSSDFGRTWTAGRYQGGRRVRQRAERKLLETG